MSVDSRQGVTFDDAWAQWADVEGYYGHEVQVRLWRPRTLKDGGRYAARLSVTVDRVKGGTVKPLTRFCEVGGTRGARTVPAALVRALGELMATLEEEADEAAAQAAF